MVRTKSLRCAGISPKAFRVQSFFRTPIQNHKANRKDYRIHNEVRMIHPMIRHGTEETGGRSNDASRPSVMVCLSPSPSNKRVIRAASRMVLQSTLSDQQPVTGRAPIALYVGASGREAQEDSRLRENIDYAVNTGLKCILSREATYPWPFPNMRGAKV